MALAKDGQRIESARDVVKDPYVFEFLDLPDRYYRESELENRLIAELEKFLLELGKGFAFIGQQYRITLNNTHFFVDLVFSHRILKCFVFNRSEDAIGESSGYWTDEYVSKLFSR
ncbi:PDDEXK nuclease domain-containing protein [Nostoc sp. WHI]|uniref:PDDEXK nuclease domain-containing protein n=1 Tax=Nostoc sp. WHI TaxID=2650611 RepID=UPI0018C7D178|nr:PDDEXK nuclease domain-containing protein [Nostoc sp. WHI]